MAYANISYMMSFLFLFSNFYIHAYMQGKRNESSGEKKEKTLEANGILETRKAAEDEKKIQ